MNKFITLFCAIAVAAALNACATAPLQIDEPYAITKEKVSLLKSNKSTKEDVTREDLTDEEGEGAVFTLGPPLRTRLRTDEWVELGGERVLMPRPLVRFRGVDPLEKPHDPAVKYLRQLRDLLDHFLNDGKLSKNDG